MKVTTLVAMVLATGSFGTTAHARENERTVVVYVSNQQIAMTTAELAKAQASQMFARIGVRIRWQKGKGSPLPKNALLIEMVEQGSIHECGAALACAQPYKDQIRVFYDRILNTVPASMLPAVLAHVLVHEITHILQGVSRHSETGVMKAHWNVADFAQMTCCPLPFTEDDVWLIQDGLAVREERVASARDSALMAGTR